MDSPPPPPEPPAPPGPAAVIGPVDPVAPLTRWTDPTALGAAVAALLLVLLFSVGAPTQALVAHIPWVIVPSALGAPFGLPALRAVPLGDLTWATTAVDTAAAVLLLVVVHRRLARLRSVRPAAGPLRAVASGWLALVVAGALTGAIRGAYIGGVTPTGVVAAVAYAAGGLVVGAAWGAALGWFVGAGAGVGRLVAGRRDVSPSPRGSWVRRGAAVAALAAGGWLLGAVVSGPLGVRGPHDGTDLASVDGTPGLTLTGVNSSGSSKSASDGQSWVTPADIRRERARLGSTSVRYLVFWSHLEPAPGRYDEAYLDQVAERVRWYAAEGYRVVLDMHQDVWGPTIGFDGAPGWATVTDGLPAQLQEQWELTYLQPGVIRAFDHFWGTASGADVQGRYVDAVTHLAQRFAEDPAVLGIDVMNEPFGGSLQGPLFEQGPLTALYQRTIDQVRTVAPDMWLFVEPQAFGVNQGLPSGLARLDDPRPEGPRLVYAPHLYALPLDLGSSYTDAKGQIDGAVGRWRDQMRATALRLGAPAWLGEFGLDGTRPGAVDYVRLVTTTIDDAGMSGFAYWDNSPGPWSPWSEEHPRRLSPIGEALAEVHQPG